MLLVSIYESGKSLNFQTVESLNDLHRGLCAGLDVKKFLSMSNFNLFFCEIVFDFKQLIKEENTSASLCLPIVENLADSVYKYMSDNLDVYFEIVKSIDEYREKIKNYKLDK